MARFSASLAWSKVPSGGCDLISWYSSNNPFLRGERGVRVGGRGGGYDRSYLVLFLT